MNHSLINKDRHRNNGGKLPIYQYFLRKINTKKQYSI